ncbi:MAG: pilus assembly protein TadG-related protein [Chloroflexota bacterium]
MTTRFTAPLQARRGDPKGQVLVLFALMLVVLLLVSALAVDYGGWLVTKRNYQNASDAASLAGAQQLTRPLAASKNVLARQAAWESVKQALDLGGVTPTIQAVTSSGANGPYVGEGYRVWVASPPSDAGAAYLGHTSGPGNVYVRIEHAGQTFLSNIAGVTRTVTAWSTAGRFPANFAVIGLCSPNSVTANCLAGDANIKLDGNNTNLIVNTGDVGTNRWTKSGGNNSGVALGADSNAYMQLFDSCWNAGGNQCNLFGYSGGAINTSDIRSAIPLGAPIQDPTYAPPTTGSTATPNQCRGNDTAAVASVQVLERNEPVADLPIALAAAVQPLKPGVVVSAANVTVSGTVRSLVGNTALSGIVVTPSSGNNSGTTNASGAWSFSVNDNNSPFTFTATDPTGVYHTTTTASTAVSGNTAVGTILMPKNPVVSGTVTSTTTGLPLNNVSITITALGTNYTTNTDASGFYTKIIPVAGNTVAYSITGVLSGYANGSASVSAPTAYDTNYPNTNFTMTIVPGSVTGTITDAVTALPVPGVVVTLGTGESATTDASGGYTIATGTGTKTITLSGTAIVATSGYAYSTPSSGTSINVNGAITRNFTVWPKGCYDGGSTGSFGNWSCSYPSGSNCPATLNPDAANVNCTFTQANAIRPGTYENITLPNGTCAWLDPKGGATGLAAGQSGGVYHINGTLDIGNGSYLFGDGVTLVFDQGADIGVGNSGGFVLNHGTHNTSANAICNTTTDFSTPYLYGETGNYCFRTAGTIASNTTTATAQTEDRSYAAWTTKAHLLWSGTQTPTFSDDAVAKGSELGITFFFYCPSNNLQCGLGNNSRMKLATANMGYLFNGVLYGPGDDIQVGGGKDGQTAAGQIVGWTIEYHGGTRILQNWYGDPVDGQPFLIEPILGE